MTAAVTATFVFTDLVDSTATAARLGPEAAEQLRQTHFKLLRGAVAASGGTEVKNLGDGLMVMYSSPSRALAGAVGMQQAVEGHNRTGKEPLGVRIGISAGEATEEDDDYFGDPVVEAARLCAAARGGQILAADLVRLMVGRNATQTFVEVGDLELKGLPEPVAAVEVQWEPESVEGTVPLPGRLVGVASDALFGFFGRSPELEAFTDACKRAQSSERAQAVFVAGEAGMGKTSLVAHAARSAHSEGAIVLFGHAVEDLGVAYQPWIEVLSSIVKHAAPETLDGLRPAQRGALARLVPEIGVDADRVGDPDTERLLLLEGATELLAAESRRAPLFVVLDDLHWADTASLQLLRQVIASAAPMNLTIGCTYRDTDLGRGDTLTQLLADLHREANVTRISLRGLEDTDVMDLIAAAAGHDLDDDGIGLAHALRRETDGNPFFTGEILRHLGESGAIVLNDEGRWVLTGELEDLGLPNSVRDVVGRRVERLGDEVVRVLSLAAVIGREFDVTLLGALTDVDEDTLLDHMDDAVAAAILVESGIPCRYRFAHALTQHSLYDELSPTRRQRAHQRIAEALELDADADDAAVLAELAHHWVAATRPAQIDKALEYVRRAGDAALAALSPDDAIRWYRQALALVEQQPSSDERRRASLLASLGTAQRHAGEPGFRETLIQAAAIAEQLGDSDVLIEAALGFASREETVGFDDTKRVASAALERVGAQPTAQRARLLAVLAGAQDGATEWEKRRDLSLEAVEAARRVGDSATLVEVINTTHTALATPDRFAEFRADAEHAAEHADTIGDPILRYRSRYLLTWVRYQECDLPAVDDLLAEMGAIVDQVGLPPPRWELGTATTGRLLLAGRADEAEATNDRTLELGTAADLPEALGTFGGLLYAIRVHQGRLDEIADFFLDVTHDNPSIAALRAAIPAMLHEIGRVDEAHEWVAAEAAGGFDFPFDITWGSCVVDALDGAASAGSLDAAHVLVEKVRPYADQLAAPTATVVKGAIARPLARCATLLGDYEQAEEWFGIAHDIHTRLQAPFWTALGQLDHADLCLARRADGDNERSRELATTATATADEYGCAGLTRRAERLLAGL
jgi:class 3 adenylate cyclase/tetratricopeptide (TPR) repeat protein